MAFASVGVRSATFASNGTAASTLTASTILGTIDASANEFGLLYVGSDNTQTTDGTSSEVTSVTGGNGTWTKLGEYTNGEGAADAGIVASLWLFVPSGSNPSGTSFTINFANASRAARTALLWGFNCAAGKVPQLAATPVYNAVDAANGFGSATISGLSSAARLYFRAMAKESNSTTNITPTTNFTACNAVRSGIQAAGVLARAEYRINTSTGETSNPTLAVAADAASVFVALEEGIAATNGTASGSIAFSGTATATNRTNGTASGSMGLTGSATGKPAFVAYLNPADKDAGITLSESNQTATPVGASANHGVRANKGATTGKWYFEVRHQLAPVNCGIGLSNTNYGFTALLGGDANSFSYYSWGELWSNGASIETVSAQNSGDVVGIALDADANKVWVHYNGTWTPAGGNPSSGAGYSIPDQGKFFPTLYWYGETGRATATFGEAPFAYSPPSGFSAWYLVPEITSGTASGSLSFAGATSGSLSIAGAAAAGFTFTGSSTGTVANAGEASGGISLTGAATATVLVSGTASGAFDLTGAAQGASLTHGQATGTFSLTGTSAATVAVTGAASGTIAFAATAEAASTIAGAATAGFTLTGTATATAAIAGQGAASLALDGTAAGAVAVVGSATGTFGITGSATGGVSTVIFTGEASGSIAFASNAAGLVAVTGTATGDFSLSGASQAALAVSGGGAGQFALSGAAAGVSAVSGAATGSFDVLGASVGAVHIAGEAAGTFVLVGAGTIGAITHAFGVGAGSFDVAGSAAGIVPAMGSAAGSFDLGGSAEGTRTTNGAVAGGIAFGGSASATVKIEAAGFGLVSFMGEAAAAVAVVASASGGIEFGGTGTAYIGVIRRGTVGRPANDATTRPQQIFTNRPAQMNSARPTQRSTTRPRAVSTGRQ